MDEGTEREKMIRKEKEIKEKWKEMERNCSPC